MPQKYGPKKNTRRARGYRRRDLGKKHKHSLKYLEKVRLKKEASLVEIPKGDIKIPRESKVKEYIFIYNWYHRVYEVYKDKRIAYDSTMNRFHYSEQTIKKAIQIIEYIKNTTCS